MVPDALVATAVPYEESRTIGKPAKCIDTNLIDGRVQHASMRVLLRVPLCEGVIARLGSFTPLGLLHCSLR